MFLYDEGLNKKAKGFYYCIFSIGLLISLSKTSMFVLVIPLIVTFKRYINLFSLVGVILLYCLIATSICIYVNMYSNFFTESANLSFLQRFAGYIYIPYAQFQDLLLGIKVPNLLINSGHVSNDIIRLLVDTNTLEFCGLPFFYLGYGILSFIVFVIFLVVWGFDGASIALVIMLTTNVTPLTNDGFVVMAWLFGYNIARRRYMPKVVSKFADVLT